MVYLHKKTVPLLYLVLSNMIEDLLVEQDVLTSVFLDREVVIDTYVPIGFKLSIQPLLLLNDGQNLAEMDFYNLLKGLIATKQIQPVICVGIHADDRINEYGTAKIVDYEGRGWKAAGYQQFLVEELLPFLSKKLGVQKFKRTGVAGFSLGGLSALDTVWNYPNLFSVAGVFSGSLWWRTKALDKGYNEATDRIMHQLIKDGTYYRHLRFFFSTGSLDETSDRNNNGIIDSIDDTLDLITELKKLGYTRSGKIKYLNFDDGRHDIATWGKAMPYFLKWAFGWGWGKV